MAGEIPLPFGGPRGVKGLYGSIQRLASQGYSLTDTLNRIQEIYSQYGGRWTTQSEAAATKLYNAFNESQVKSIQLGNYIRDASISSRHIAYNYLQRSIQNFVDSPTFNVRYRAVVNVEGVPFDVWRTAIYSGPGALPPSIFELSNDISNVQLPDTDGHISPSDVQIAEVQITAV